MKSFSRLFMILSGITAVFVISQCDSSNTINGPNGENSPADYTVTLSIEPTAVYKTAGMRNVWDKTITADFETSFEDDFHNDEMPMGHHHAHQDADDNSHGHERYMGHNTDDYGFIGSMTVDDMHILVMADHASDMFHMHDDNNEGHSMTEFDLEHGNEGDFMMQVHLYDALHVRETTAGTSIGHIDITLIARDDDSNEYRFHMNPLSTEDGLYYASNAALPQGEYEIEIEAGAPSFSRMPGHENMWNNHMTTEFHDFSFDGHMQEMVEIGMTEDSELTFMLKAHEAEAFYSHDGSMMSLEGDETVQFLLKVSDESIQSEYHDIQYFSVTMKIHHNESGEMIEEALMPVYGKDGFHYAANMIMPGSHGNKSITQSMNMMSR